jgi:hypothetical protein
MDTEDFSLKRFLRIGHLGSIAAGILIGLAAGPAANGLETILRIVGGGILGLVVSGCFYLFLYSKEIANLDIPAKELDESESVLLKNVGSLVHYKSGRPLWFWEAVEGKVFLTNQVLEFRAHRGQPFVYCLTIPLNEIAQALPCRILGLFAGGLRIERFDGTVELFTFGVFGDNAGWASAIMAARGVSPEEWSGLCGG